MSFHTLAHSTLRLLLTAINLPLPAGPPLNTGELNGKNLTAHSLEHQLVDRIEC